MLGVDCSDGLMVLLLKLLLLRKMLLMMLKNRCVRGRENGCDSGDGGRQLGLQKRKNIIHCRKRYPDFRSSS